MKNIPQKALITAIYLFSISLPALAIDFNDIKDVSPRDGRIGIYRELIEQQVLTLDKKGEFRPDQPINKAAFLKASLSYLGYKPGKSFNYFTGYKDVPEESWYAPYVKKALEIRALNNRLGDYFSPDSQITRQDALLLTMSIYGLPTPLTQPEAADLYKDIRTTHPLASVYAGAKAKGLYFENSQENFQPNKILTRGDAADLLFKAKLAAHQQGTPGGSVMIGVPDSSSGLTESEKSLLENEKFAILIDAWDKINNQYVYTDKVNQNELIYGAISGMVDSLEDPYSTFKSPTLLGDSFIYIPQDYEGIGAVIEQIDGKYTVQTTLNNSPADRAGLKTGDIIEEIDGKALKDLAFDKVMAMIKGKSGTIIKLKVRRNNTILDFSIIREKISIESIQTKVLTGNINYVRLDQFTENSGQEFEQAIEQIKKSGSKKLIIDLRNNPGGYLTSTQKILGFFLEKDQIEFYTVDRNEAKFPAFSEGNGELKDYKTVVLINEGSASASEIMAGALQDLKLAHIIGTTSFGKGSVQEISSYTDNSTLKLTIAKWYTPNYRNISHEGIIPDEKVTITEQQKQSGQDPQLDAAIYYLNK
ncbi:S41 family peptidase [Candidatus Peregrinibacteria bacterium]|nr:S41 family peptidase [Candidatus Peregrinibacteria bacterium]